MELQDFFKANHKFAIGFSGGVDSSYLLYAAVQAGCDVKAYYVKSCFQPEFEYADAMRLAAELSADVQVLSADPLTDPAIRANPQNRCYYCKQKIFGMIKQEALAAGYSLLLDGTNASDDEGDRPGMKVLKELSVRSPLKECGLTKRAVRIKSREAGLFTWDKPSYSCLATRMPTGHEITKEELAKIEGAEMALFQLGFTDFRVRNWGRQAKLELTAADMARAVKEQRKVRAALQPYFPEVLMDLQARKGEFDES